MGRSHKGEHIDPVFLAQLPPGPIVSDVKRKTKGAKRKPKKILDENGDTVEKEVKRTACPLCFRELISNRKNFRKHFKDMHNGETIDDVFLASLPVGPNNKQYRSKLNYERQICTVCGKDVLRYSMKKHMRNKHKHLLPPEGINVKYI